MSENFSHAQELFFMLSRKYFVKKCVLFITIITNLSNSFQIVRYSNRNHKLDANIHHLVMAIVMMLTTMQVVTTIMGIVKKMFENVPNVNVLIMSAPYANVLTPAMNNVKTFFATLIIKICYSCAKIKSILYLCKYMISIGFKMCFKFKYYIIHQAN